MTMAVAEPRVKFESVLEVQSALMIEGTLVDQRTIRRWCEAMVRDNGEAKTHRLGRRWRIVRAELVSYMRRG